MALGEKLPECVFGHGWLLQNGDKMSKSKGNVLYADRLADDFGDDCVRYFVMHEMHFADDGSASVREKQFRPCKRVGQSCKTHRFDDQPVSRRYG